MGLTALVLLLQTMAPQVSADSVRELRDAALDAQRHYEFLLRRLAPVTLGSGWSGDDCDEIVGRFCLRFSDDVADPVYDPPEENQRVVNARKEAVETYRRYFAVRPGEREAAGPLVRYLIEDGRPSEGLAAARTYAWASRDESWGSMLLGFALHANGEDEAAEMAFDGALASFPPGARDRILRLDILVEPEERRAYGGLDQQTRQTYDTAFWRLADPLYLLRGNGRRAEHLARRVQASLMAEAPVVRGMYRWGDDLEELTARYGVPTRRERVLGSGLRSASMVEHYSPRSVSFAPPALRSRGFAPQPEPGGRWVLDPRFPRSLYAPVNLDRLFELDHQVSVLPRGDSAILRVDARIPLDSLGETAAAVETGLFLLDSLVEPVTERRRIHRRRAADLVLSAEIAVAPGRYVYSAEALDTVTRRAARARHRFDVPPYVRGLLSLSDPLLGEPFGSRPLPPGRDDSAVRPLGSLIVAPTDTLGIYAEAHDLAAGDRGVTEYDVELALYDADGQGFPARAIGWLGRVLGLAGPDEQPRLSWSGEGTPGLPAIIAVDLDLGGIDQGLYRLELTVRDRILGTKRTRSRVIRLSDDRGS